MTDQHEGDNRAATQQPLEAAGARALTSDEERDWQVFLDNLRLTASPDSSAAERLLGRKRAKRHFA